MFLLWAKNVYTYSPLAKLAVDSYFLTSILHVESSYIGQAVSSLVEQSVIFSQTHSIRVIKRTGSYLFGVI
jgi:hypothetical protein